LDECFGALGRALYVAQRDEDEAREAAIVIHYEELMDLSVALSSGGCVMRSISQCTPTMGCGPRQDGGRGAGLHHQIEKRVDLGHRSSRVQSMCEIPSGTADARPDSSDEHAIGQGGAATVRF
jgi:hypothetical protein